MKIEDFNYLFERVNLGIDAHPSQRELEQLHTWATSISPNGDFSYRGCQSCVNYMVKFVFDNQTKINAEANKTKAESKAEAESE